VRARVWIALACLAAAAPITATATANATATATTTANATATAATTATATATGSFVERCPARIVARRFGVVLVARHLRVTSLNFNAAAIRSYAIRPTIGCRTARRAVRAYLVAVLNRPENRCAGPSAGGRPCKVGKWLCEKTHPRLPPKPSSPAGMQQTCQHFRFRDNTYIGQTNINFWELDYDHG
jgi:hypothetical protein